MVGHGRPRGEVQINWNATARFGSTKAAIKKSLFGHSFGQVRHYVVFGNK
jgi:hypothetical protein